MVCAAGSRRSFERSRLKLEEHESRRGLCRRACLEPLPPQRQLPRPLSPSGAGTIIGDEDERWSCLSCLAALFSEKERADRSLEKGRLTIACCRHFPEIAAAERAWLPQAATPNRAARFWPGGRAAASLSISVLETIER